MIYCDFLFSGGRYYETYLYSDEHFPILVVRAAVQSCHCKVGLYFPSHVFSEGWMLEISTLLGESYT